MKMEQRMRVAYMRLLRGICRVTWDEKSWNEYMKGSKGVAIIIENWENKLRSLRHVQWAMGLR